MHVPNQKNLLRRRQQGGLDGDRAEGGVGASGLSISLARHNGTHNSLLADLSAECQGCGIARDLHWKREIKITENHGIIIST